MKQFILAAILLISIAAKAQNDKVFKRIISDYKCQKMSYTQLDKDLFELYLKNKQSNSRLLIKEILTGVETLNILHFDNSKKVQTILDDLKKRYEIIGWTTFKESREAPRNFSILLKKIEKNIKGIVYISVKQHHYTLLEFKGEHIDLNKISSLSKMMNIQGADELRNINTEDVSISIVDDSKVVRIKGSATFKSLKQPLFVVNGKIVDNMEDINADNIASISVLKDASATALYGSMGANGVILVTLKDTQKSFTGIIKDHSFLRNPQKQPIFVLDNKKVKSFKDIDPVKVKSINVLVPPVSTAIYGSQAAYGAVVAYTTKQKDNNFPMIIVDGYKLPSFAQLSKLKLESQEIKTMIVLKDQESCKVYGADPKKGVVILNTRKPLLQEGKIHKTNFSIVFYDKQVHVINLYDIDLPIFILDGKEVSVETVRALQQKQIKVIKMHTKEEAFFNKIKKSVVEITLK